MIDPDLDLGGRLYLSDEMSAALERVGGAWDRAVAGANRGGEAMVSACARVEGRMASFATGVQAAVGRGVGTFVQAAGALTGQSAVAAAVLGGPMGLLGALGTVAAGAVRTGVAFDDLQIGFSRIMHSADAARQHLQELQTFAVGKPYSFEFLSGQSRVMQTYGFQAREVRGLLTDIGDAASGAGTGVVGFQAINRVLGQVRATGRITQGQLSMLTDAGVAGFDILRERLHLTAGQLSDIARSGVPAERIITALREGMRERFGGAMAEASETLGSRLSDLGDTAGNLARAIYEVMGPALGPWIARLSDGASRNMETLAAVLGGAVVGALRLLMVVALPVFYAFRDAAAGATTGATTGFGSLVRTIRRAASILEGVTALVMGDDGSGRSSISEALKQRLEAEGVWPMVVRLSRLAGLIRATLRGIFEGFAAMAGERAGTFGRVFGALTGAADRMAFTRDQARELGHWIARAVAAFFALQGALAVVRYASTAVQTLVQVSGALRVAWGILAAHPLLLALAVVALAFGALYLYARRNRAVMDALRAAWTDVVDAFTPLREAFRAVLPIVRGALTDAFQVFADVAVGAFESLRPVWPVVRLILSALAVVGYLAALVFGKVLKGAVGLALLPLVMIARAVGALARFALPYLRDAFLWAFSTAQKLAPVLLPVLRSVWSVLRVIGSVVMVVLYGAFVGLWRLVRWTFEHTVGTVWKARGAFGRIFSSIGQSMRDAFAPLLPFVTPIFEAIAGVGERVFGGMVDTLLGALRSMAGALVSAFERLPPELRPAALNGAISNLRAFSSGKGLTVNDGKTAATEALAAPAADGAPGRHHGGDPHQGSRDTINRSRGAPARAARELQRAHEGLSMALVSGPAPQVNVTVQPAPVTLDGRLISGSVQRHQDTERLRAGGTVPNR